MENLKNKKTKKEVNRNETIINNLKIAQNMISGDIVKSEVKTSSKEGYEFAYTISSQDLSGENRIYEFYYNETELRTDDLFESDGSIAPSLRGDDIVNPDIKTFKSLEMTAGVKISGLDDYKKAISINSSRKSNAYS